MVNLVHRVSRGRAIRRVAGRGLFPASARELRELQVALQNLRGRSMTTVITDGDRAAGGFRFSPYRDETVDSCADLVLPDHTFLERWESTVPAPALDRASIGVRVPVVEPLHNTRATGDVAIELGHRIGGALAAAMPWGSYREACEAQLRGLREINRGNVRALTHRDFVRTLVEKTRPIRSTR